MSWSLLSLDDPTFETFNNSPLHSRRELKALPQMELEITFDAAAATRRDGGLEMKRIKKMLNKYASTAAEQEQEAIAIKDAAEDPYEKAEQERLRQKRERRQFLKKELIYATQIYSTKMILMHCFAPDKVAYNYTLGDACLRANELYPYGIYTNQFVLAHARKLGMQPFDGVKEFLPAHPAKQRADLQELLARYLAKAEIV